MKKEKEFYVCPNLLFGIVQSLNLLCSSDNYGKPTETDEEVDLLP